jgi:hypothetical protein
MPIPLSLAFACMNFAKNMHTSIPFERPIKLRKLFYFRFISYLSLGIGTYFNALYKIV